MKSNRLLPFAFPCVLLISWCLPGLAWAAPPPNIIIFLADDLGYGDIGANGCKDIVTPNLDELARNGVRFTDGYATHPVCSPSRAGLMSGMYQHRFGFEHNSGPERFAAPNFGLPRAVPTLAEKLRAAGYATGMVGKWHIGFQPGLRPHERGYGSSFVFHSGARSYLVDPTGRNPMYRDGVKVPDDPEYLTDAFAREAVGFIERSRSGPTPRPFFLYFAFNAVHSPLEATAAYEARFPAITERKRKTYAGMLSALDDAIGRVLARVRALGQEENTLVLFYSDNGGPTFETTSRNDPLRGYKGQMYEGGIRVPFIAQWKGTLPAGKVYREMIMGFDYHATALAAAGLAVPNDKPLDGVNLLPFLTGRQSGRPHEQLFWRSGEQHAARVGDWKLVAMRGEPTMLFNLRSDLSEKNNLATAEPTQLKALQAAFAGWEKGMQPAKWIRQDASNAEPGGKLKSATAAKAGQTKAGAKKAGARLEAAFKSADKNGDGKLSREESRQPEIFSDADQNGDGTVTLEELRAYYASRRAAAAAKE